MVTYQVHVHLNNPAPRHVVADFDTMTAAYLYLLDAISNLLFHLPVVQDVVWVDDDLVRFVDADGTVLGTATVVMHEGSIH